MRTRMLLGVAFLLMLSGCDKMKSNVDQMEEMREGYFAMGKMGLQIKTVPSYRVSTLEANERNTTYGIVAAAKEMSLSFGASGKIAQINVKKGDKVEAGKVLAQLDTTVWQQEIASAESQVARASAEKIKGLQGADQHDLYDLQLQINKAKQKLAVANDELSKGKRLYDSGAIAKSELDRLDQAQKQAMIDLQAEQNRSSKLQQKPSFADQTTLHAGIKQAQVQLARAQQELKATQLIAPFSGIVAEVNQNVSEQIGSGQAVVKLMDDSAWIVNLQVNSGQITQWKQGAELTIQSVGNTSIPGVVTFVSPILDEKKGTYTVEVAVLGNPQNWKTGMTVSTQITSKDSKDIYVPVSAVGLQDGERFVIVIDGGKAKRQIVTIGAIHNDMYQIKEGISDGQVIVRSGLSYVAEGEAVKESSHE
ncbi:efflux RND transporter periplasmic adaptor subunit [Brevibacillus laterosporus]|uniref:efflux RND transporter periplasmic adaptor subunit n=1 Tax=Brevibacillus laterosporus TaxID=1465 RepID=UPI001EF1B388|nr:efflux RND transporter periplasmic adaptor subunit [Brevibacillus laterosporus]